MWALQPSPALAQDAEPDDICPKVPSGEDAESRQWEHVLLLDTSKSMFKNGVWEQAKAAFAEHAAALPLGHRVAFYTFNVPKTRSEFAAELDPESPSSRRHDALTAEERDRLVAHIEGLPRPKGQVTPLSFYYDWLLREHGSERRPAFGRTFSIYTDGDDESCTRYTLKRLRRLDQKGAVAACEALVADVQERVAARRREGRFFVWSETKPEVPCSEDEPCEGGSPCVRMRSGRRACVLPPKSRWSAEFRPAERLRMARETFRKQDVVLGHLQVKEAASFPAFLYARWTPAPFRADAPLEVELAMQILDPGGYRAEQDGPFPRLSLATQANLRQGRPAYPASVEGVLELRACAGGVVLPQSTFPLEIGLPHHDARPDPFIGLSEDGRRHQLRGKEGRRRAFPLHGAQAHRLQVGLRTDPVDDVYAGIDGARLTWTRSAAGTGASDNRSHACTTERLGAGRVEVVCPPLGDADRAAGGRAVPYQAFLELTDPTGLSGIERHRLPVRLLVPPRHVEGGGGCLWYGLGLLLLALCAYGLWRWRRYPPVVDGPGAPLAWLSCEDPSLPPRAVLAPPPTPLSRPVTRHDASALTGQATSVGGVEFRLRRSGELLMKPLEGEPVRWGGQVVHESVSVGALERSGGFRPRRADADLRVGEEGPRWRLGKEVRS